MWLHSADVKSRNVQGSLDRSFLLLSDKSRTGTEAKELELVELTKDWKSSAVPIHSRAYLFDFDLLL